MLPACIATAMWEAIAFPSGTAKEFGPSVKAASWRKSALTRIHGAIPVIKKSAHATEE